MLDTCYAMLEFFVTVTVVTTVLLVVLMFRALVEFGVTLAWQYVHASELYLMLQLPLTCFIARCAHAQTHTHVSGNRSLLHALQWHVARIRQLRRGASL